MKDTVKSAERVLDILELFALQQEPLRLREIAGELGIPKSSALMLLRTLEGRGYLLREGERYQLDPVWQSDEQGLGGWVGGGTMRLIRVAEPVIRDLVEMLEETVVLGVPTSENDVRVVANLMSPLAVRYDRSRKTVIPAYCTALGQAMLAFRPKDESERYVAACPFEPLTDRTITDPMVFRDRLSQIRVRGWAINLEERFIGAVGIAVPILCAGAVAGALNVGTVMARFRRRQREIVAALQDGVAVISEQIGPLHQGRFDTGRRKEG
jgi:DNA-binding IclR family transcriptional regulator